MSTPTVTRPSSRSASPRGGGRAVAASTRDTIAGWAFVAPLILGISLFNLYPMMLSLYSSFTSWNGFGTHDWIGLQNFATISKDDIFWQTLRNTLYFTAFTIPLTMSIAFLMALLCNNRHLRARGFFRTVFFTPFVTNVVAISLIWSQLYTPGTGLIAKVLAIFGIEGPSWLTSSTWAMPAVIIVAVWHGIGFPMLIMLSALQGIPNPIYEAAEIDGARGLARMFRITLPLISPQIFFVLITQIIATFQVFGIIFVMTKGGPANQTSVYIYNLYQKGFILGQLGYASALAWLLFILILAMTFIQLRIQKRWVFYG